DQLLDELEARDRFAELRPLARVADRGGEAALRDPDAAGGERDAAVVERRHRDLEAVALGAESVGVVHPDVLEEELRGVLRAEAELALDRPRAETGAVGRDGEARDAAGAVGAGAGEDGREARPAPKRDEQLGAVQDPAAAVALCAPRAAAGIGARARLRQRVAAETC